MQNVLNQRTTILLTYELGSHSLHRVMLNATYFIHVVCDCLQSQLFMNGFFLIFKFIYAMLRHNLNLYFFLYYFKSTKTRLIESEYHNTKVRRNYRFHFQSYYNFFILKNQESHHHGRKV